MQLHVLYTHKAEPITFTHASKTYLVAFPMKTMAQRTRQVLHHGNLPKLTVSRHISNPSAKKTDQVLYELGLDPRQFRMNYTYQDTEAYLHIPVMPHPKTHPPFQWMERPLTDILLYPFVKNIGLMLPLGIVQDTDAELVLETQLVEPSAQLDLFRNELEKSFH
jgi:hypothetical protein